MPSLTLTEEQATQILVMARQMEATIRLHRDTKPSRDLLVSDASRAAEYGDDIQRILCNAPREAPVAPENPTLYYAACPVCGADDCKYEPLGPLCPEGHEWLNLEAKGLGPVERL